MICFWPNSSVLTLDKPWTDCQKTRETTTMKADPPQVSRRRKNDRRHQRNVQTALSIRRGRLPFRRSGRPWERRSTSSAPWPRPCCCDMRRSRRWTSRRRNTSRRCRRSAMLVRWCRRLLFLSAKLLFYDSWQRRNLNIRVPIEIPLPLP